MPYEKTKGFNFPPMLSLPHTGEICCHKNFELLRIASGPQPHLGLPCFCSLRKGHLAQLPQPPSAAAPISFPPQPTHLLEAQLGDRNRCHSDSRTFHPPGRSACLMATGDLRCISWGRQAKREGLIAWQETSSAGFKRQEPGHISIVIHSGH